MKPSRLRRIVGLLRAASGLLFMFKPAAVATTWVGSESRDVSVLTRSIGSRDFVIGAGLLATGRPEWLIASVASDLADGLEAAFGSVPDERRREVLAWAFGFAALGIASELAVDHANGRPSNDRPDKELS